MTTGRSALSRFLWIAVAGLFLAGNAAAPAEARRKKAPAKRSAAKVNEGALGELMGPFKFGMNQKQVLKILSQQIAERYKEKISATADVYAQDKLRREQKSEIARIKKSAAEFKGKKSGWDVSIIDDQFAHGSGESMMVYWENEPGSGKDQRRFFFFHEGRLYKMFIALSGDMVKGEQRSFSYFKDLMEKRYGPAQVATSPGASVEVVDWKTPKYHVQAIDKLSFYGSFILVISDPRVEAVVAELRAANKKPAKSNAILDSVLEGADAPPPSLDSNKASVDSITTKKN